jgi:hypothetical protein
MTDRAMTLHPSPWLTTQEAAQRLRCSTKTVYDAVARGQLRSAPRASAAGGRCGSCRSGVTATSKRPARRWTSCRDDGSASNYNP